MKTLKSCSVYAALNLLVFSAFAGAKLPVDASGEVVYKHSFKLQSNFKDDEAYTLVQNWFNASGACFACQNTVGPSVTCKNKVLIEQTFNNAQPLQSLDPSSGRMTGKGLMKYFGGANSAIGVLYMEYYVVIEINGHQLTATISNMKYHHYNQRTYVEKPIYGWDGGRPFDAADKLGSLISKADENKEVQDIGSFVNKKMSLLLNNLQSYLQVTKMLDPSQYNQVAISED